MAMQMGAALCLFFFAGSTLSAGEAALRSNLSQPLATDSSSCEVGLPSKTGVSIANASSLLLYRTLIWTEICGNPKDPNNPFVQDVGP